MEATECGAAALAMVLAYFGKWVPVEQLRVACGVSRDGSNALNLVKAARSFGLDCQGMRYNIDRLSQAPFPLIAFWNFSHFVVVEGISSKFAWVADPALGRRRVSLAEFSKSFTGVALTFKPSAAFQTGGEPPRIIRSLFAQAMETPTAFWYVVLATLLLVIPGIILPVFSKVFVDQVLVSAHIDWVRTLLLLFGITTLVNLALTWLQQASLMRLEMRLTIVSANRMLWRLLRLPLTYFNQRTSGDIMARVQANMRVAQAVSGGLSSNLVGIITLGFYAALMLSYSGKLGTIVTALSGLNLGLLRWVVKASANDTMLVSQASGGLMAVTVGGLASMENVKASGAEDVLFARWAGQQAQFATLEQRVIKRNQIASVFPTFVSSVVNLVVLGYGALLVMKGDLSIGDLMAFQILAGSFMGPIGNLVGMGNLLQSTAADLRRIEDVIKYPLPARAEPLPLPEGDRLGGLIEFRHVTFGHNPLLPPVVSDLSFTVRPGERVAIVGPSGCGKSTVIKLLAGLYEPWSGEILIDGVPVDRIDRTLFTNSIAMVDQEIVLFAGSVDDNIRLWDTSLPSRHVEQALRDACIFETVMRRPGGIAAAVTEDGRNFSGGERQRLEIARALARQPTIILMDEATAALDPLVEAELDDNLRRRGSAMLIVAHRLSTIRDCDEILVLERGILVQRGRHEDLVQGGTYAQLAKAL